MAMKNHKSKSLMQMLDDELLCGVCLELYNVPLMLPCGHNFCKLCVDGIIDSFSSFSAISIGPATSFNCPICQLPIKFRKNGIDELPVNRALENVVSLYKNCSPVDVFDTSWNSDIQVTIGSCIKHDKLLQDRFCTSCDIAMCSKCEDSHCTETNTHKVEPVQKLANSYQCEIAYALAAMKKRTIPLNDRMNLLEEMLSEIKDQETFVEMQLEGNITSLMAQLRRQQELLKSNVEKAFSSVKRPVSDELVKCQATKTNLQAVLKNVYTVTKVRDACVRIKLMKNLCQQLKLVGCDVSLAAHNAQLPIVTMPSMDLLIQGVIESINTLCWTTTKIVKPQCAGVNAVTQTNMLEKDSDCDKVNEPKKLNTTNESFSSHSADILRSHSHGSITTTFPAKKDEAPASAYDVVQCSRSLNDVSEGSNCPKLKKLPHLESASNAVAISVAGQDREIHLDFPAVTCQRVESTASLIEKMQHLEMKDVCTVKTRQSFPLDSPSRANFELPPAEAWEFKDMKRRKEKIKKRSPRHSPKTAEALANFMARRKSPNVSSTAS